MAIRENWIHICYRINAKNNGKTNRTIESTFDELHAAYTGPDRHYHNIDHISEGLIKIREILHLVQFGIVLEIAWWFHDFVYNTSMKNNEEESAKFADKILSELGIHPQFKKKIVQRIMATTHDHIPEDPDDKLMVDIDLIRLADPIEVFEQNSNNIRLEHGATAEAYATGRAEFFKKFLQGRPSIYLTDYFKERYEARAQDNVRRAMAVLEK
jgi:predicted metal-dependent HD superfamily phosphohydrolase